MKLNTPEQNLEIEKVEKMAFSERAALLEDMAKRSGYELVSSVGDLALTKEEKNQLSYIKLESVAPYFLKSRRYLKATRQDGILVKILIEIRENIGNDEFVADIFSPAFPSGHASNHDFNRSEIEHNLRIALDNPVYPKK